MVSVAFKYVSQPSATSYAFSSVLILLLYVLYDLVVLLPVLFTGSDTGSQLHVPESTEGAGWPPTGRGEGTSKNS